MVKSSQKSEGVKRTEQSSDIKCQFLYNSDAGLKNYCSTISLCHVLAISESLGSAFYTGLFSIKRQSNFARAYILFSHQISQSELLYISFIWVLICTARDFTVLSFLWALQVYNLSPPSHPTFFFLYILCLTATECPLPDTGYWHSCSFSLTQNNFFFCVCVSL